MTLVPTSPLDAFCASGTSPTLHLRGAGAVGRAWLSLVPPRWTLVGVTDSSGSVLHPSGLAPELVALHKQCGRSLADWVSDGGVLAVVDDPSPSAHLVIDATPTRATRGVVDAARIRGWRARGQRVALASKHAVAADPTLLSDPGVGVNAVLGGTGARLQAELAELRAAWRSAAVVGSASTTVIIEAMETGRSLEEALAVAAARGVLEPDPELDLRGDDARLKLALVAGALLGEPVDPAALVVPDLRSLDPRQIREHAQHGRTTRLVGRASRAGELTLAYEAVDHDAFLASPSDRLTYAYQLADGWRVHTGTGLGAAGTAQALHADVCRLLGVSS